MTQTCLSFYFQQPILEDSTCCGCNLTNAHQWQFFILLYTFYVYYTFQIYLHAFLPSWRKTTVSLLFLSSIFGLYALLAHVGRTRIPWRSGVKGNVVYWSFCVAVSTNKIRSVCHKCLSSTAKGQAGIPGTPGIPGKRGYRVGLEWNEHPYCLVSVIIISN